MILVDADPETMRLTVDAPSRLADVLSRLPGLQVNAEAGEWEGPVTASNMIAVASEVGKLPGFSPTDRASSLMAAIKKTKGWVEAVKSGAETVASWDERLYDYQVVGVWMLLERKRMLLGDEMGTGKTVMALTAARQVRGATLVVSPNSMKHRWAREAEVWYPEVRTFVVHGTAKQKEQVLEDAHAAWLAGEAILVSVNWEALRTLSRVAGYGSQRLTEKEREAGPLNKIGWRTVIADEAHRAKDPNSKQTRALWAVANGAEYRWALTGTPTLNTPGDLWAIGRFYDPDSFGKSRHKWHNRYVAYIETNWGPKDMGLNMLREPEFTSWFDMNFIRRTTGEVLTLPPLRGGLLSEDSVLDVREIEMTSKQKTAYNKMVKDMIVAIDDGILVATDPLALLTRLSQIASATPVISPDGEVVALDAPSNKIDAVLEILDEMDEDRQIVVFAQSRKLVELLAGKLTAKGIESIQITGAVDPGVRDVYIQKFQAGQARVALATLAAGGTGIDLYAADTAVFMQRGYSYGDSLQAEARVYRNGQDAERVHIIDLVSRDTVDEAVIEALQSKGEMAEQVLRDKARELMRSKA